MKLFKKTFALAAMVFFSAISFAQAKLEGSWKAAKVEVGTLIYIDMEKDSVFFSDAFINDVDKEEKMDSATKASTINVLKATLGSAFKSITINIDEKGGIYENQKNEKIGQYDADKKTMTFVDSDTKKSTTIPLEIKDGLLKVIFPDEEQQLVIWCRKEK